MTTAGDGRAQAPDVNLEGARTRALLKIGALQAAMFNSPKFSTIATDAMGVIQIFSVGAERMLGYAAVDVVNRSTPGDMSDPQEAVARAKALSVEFHTSIAPGFAALAFKASRGMEDVYELTYIRKDGSRFQAVVSVTALRDASDVIIGYLLIATDHTARRQPEEERKKLEQRQRDQNFYTRSLIESNIDALMTTDTRGIITDVNRQAEVLTGCTRDALVGAPFKNYFTDPRRAEVGIDRALADGQIRNYPLTARTGNGPLTMVSCNATTFHDRNGSLQGVSAAVRDVTEQKLFERRLRQNKAELEGANRMSSEFLADRFHELRTPLNAIIGFSEALRDGLMGEMSEKQRGFVGDILSSGLQLDSLINDVLRVSRVETGKALDLEAALRATAEEARAPAETPTGAILEVTAGARTALVVEDDLASADLIRVQLEAQGFKVLHAASAEAALALAMHQPVSLITLDIMLPHMGGWEFLGRLKQVPALRHIPVVIISIVADRNKGFALGAAAVLQKPISRQELHESLVELGLFPLAPGQTLKVLVVDDDPKAVELLAVRMKGMASTVLRAYGGREAIEAARQEQPDLIFLDLMMPEVNGFDVVEALNQRADTARIPILVVTAKQITDDDRGKLNGYVATIMEKAAFDQNRFAAEVRRAMSGRPLAA